MSKLSEKKYYVGVDENDKKLYYTPAEICEELGDDIKALEKENERLNDLGAKQATSLEEAYTELQKLKDDRDSIKEELDELYKGGDPIGMMVRASANSYRDMKEFVNKKLDELLNQSNER